MSLFLLKKEIRKYAKKDRALMSARFFKTGKGDYGEGDRFLGLTMGEQRKISKMFQDLGFSDVSKLLESSWHEERMIGLLILILHYESNESRSDKREIFDFYLSHRSSVNNWDLVDVTTPNIVGDFLSDEKDRNILYTFAVSKNFWERRMAMLATFSFIRNCDFFDTLAIAEILLSDSHDLIHKAVGWMLREVGKRDVKTLVGFLEKHSSNMPRTMLRYAVEKFSPEERTRFLERN